MPLCVNTTSSSQLTLLRSGSAPYASTLWLVTSESFSCFVTSVYQSPPNDSKCTTDTGRGPSTPTIAISTAPVAEAGTMPMW